MSFGTVSTMISSLKSNNRLRRNRESYSKFYKKPMIHESTYQPISKEENLRIIKENKRMLKEKTKYKVLFGLSMVFLYGTIIAYTILIFLK